MLKIHGGTIDANKESLFLLDFCILKHLLTLRSLLELLRLLNTFGVLWSSKFLISVFFSSAPEDGRHDFM